jgi:hypothetical protein
VGVPGTVAAKIALELVKAETPTLLTA